MTITVNTKSYDLDSYLSKDAVRYAGPSSDFQTVDTIDLKRTAPKPTKDFAGVARSQLKLTRSMTMTDGSKFSAIFDLQVSVPVGAAESDVDSIIADLASLLSAGGVGKKVIYNFDINQ